MVNQPSPAPRGTPKISVAVFRVRLFEGGIVAPVRGLQCIPKSGERIRGARSFSFALHSLAIADTIDFANPAFAPVTGPTSAAGHAEFLARRIAASAAPTAMWSTVETPPARRCGSSSSRSMMRSIRAIVPETDQDLYKVAEYWTYPDGRGDCEDIALAKRKALIAAGWDARARC